MDQSIMRFSEEIDKQDKKPFSFKVVDEGQIQSILKKNVINLDSFLISTPILPSMLSFQAKQHFVTFAFLKFK